MHYIVYKTTNLLNGRFYVGVHGTGDPEIFDGYFGSGKLLRVALKKYGKENFIRETLINCFEDEDEAYSVESILVKTVKEDPRAYNIVNGGCGGTGPGKLGGIATLKSGKNWFQHCPREKLLEYAQKSNETKISKNSKCVFKNIEWQRENSKNNDHSGAKSILTFTDGVYVIKFKPSDRFDEELTKKELSSFMDANPTFKRGGLNKQKKRNKRFYYNDGKRNYCFSATTDLNANQEFCDFIIENKLFTVGKIRQLTKGE